MYFFNNLIIWINLILCYINYVRSYSNILSSFVLKFFLFFLDYMCTFRNVCYHNEVYNNFILSNLIYAFWLFYFDRKRNWIADMTNLSIWISDCSYGTNDKTYRLSWFYWSRFKAMFVVIYSVARRSIELCMQIYVTHATRVYIVTYKCKCLQKTVLR